MRLIKRIKRHVSMGLNKDRGSIKRQNEGSLENKKRNGDAG